MSKGKLTYSVQKLVRLEPSVAHAISEFRHEHRIASETAVIRHIINAGLERLGIEVPGKEIETNIT